MLEQSGSLCIFSSAPQIARLWYYCVLVFSLSINVCFILVCSAFSEYNMDQFTPAKVDRDQVNTLCNHFRILTTLWSLSKPSHCYFS